jgi:site-specific recombinase XerD
MANRKYRKDYLTKIKGSENWYLQFFIKPHYRQLPFFKSNQKWATRRNYLQTLKTPHYPEAAVLANKILEDIGIRSKPVPPPLSTGTQAYFETLRDLKTRSDDELLKLKDAFEELRNEAISEPTYPGSLVVLDEITLDHYSKALEAINREAKERAIPHYSKPYPYQITLKQLAEEYRSELVEDGADFKAQSKLHHAVRKLLKYRNVDDIEVRLIKPKFVVEYVRYSKSVAVAEGTLRSELAMLSNIYKFGVSQEYLATDNNPFRNVSLKGFKPKLGREPFTEVMHKELVKAAKSDADMAQLVQCSYYTGMRLSEVFDAKFKTIGDITCFDVATAGGKTKSATRLIPIHSKLLPVLRKRYSFEDGQRLRWNRQTADAVGKEFGRMKQRVLMDLGIIDKAETRKYVHHSYRHGFVTMMFDAGLDEMQFIDLTGHKKSYIGKTEAGKTYAGVAKIQKLQKIIELMPPLE